MSGQIKADNTMTKNALSSMTGFARFAGGDSTNSWTVNLKSVNGKGLDIRLNLRHDLDDMSGDIRRLLAKHLHRGNITLSLGFDADTGQNQTEKIRVNQRNLSTLVETLKARSGQKVDANAIATLMTIRGVVDVNNGTAAQNTDLDRHKLLQDIELAAQDLVRSRQSEGQALLNALIGYLVEMRSILDRAKTVALAHPETIRKALSARLESFSMTEPMSEDRLEHEIALLATKADIQEEITRLEAHFTDADAKLRAGSPAGKPLEFLAQEMRRETNTICSKSQDIHLTKAGLELKSLIDQFKEQVANVE